MSSSRSSIVSDSSSISSTSSTSSISSIAAVTGTKRGHGKKRMMKIDLDQSEAADFINSKEWSKIESRTNKMGTFVWRPSASDVTKLIIFGDSDFPSL